MQQLSPKSCVLHVTELPEPNALKTLQPWQAHHPLLLWMPKNIFIFSCLGTFLVLNKK